MSKRKNKKQNNSPDSSLKVNVNKSAIPKKATLIKNKTKKIAIIGLAGFLLISVIVWICARNNDVKITSSKAIERAMDDLNVSDNRLNISSFDATDPAQVKELLEDYKKQFEAAGIDINYRYFEYLVLLNNGIFPMELDDISIDDFRAFFRSIDETIIAVVESNLKTMPDSYISLADTYGKRNPIDGHFVDLFERLQVEVVNSCRNDSEEEMTRIIDSYFKFQLEFIIKGESFIVDESEVTFESLGIRAKEKILLSTIFINRYLMQKDFIPQFIVCEEYNRETMKTEPVRYSLSVIQDVIDELYKDNRHQMKIEKFSGGDYVHTK